MIVQEVLLSHSYCFYTLSLSPLPLNLLLNINQEDIECGKS